MGGSLPDPDLFLCVGKITKPHGIKGELKVFPYSGDPTDFQHYRTLVLTLPKGWRPTAGVEQRPVLVGREIGVIASRIQGENALLVVEGVDDRTGAEQLAGVEVWTRKEYLPPLEAGEFYWHEMVGLKVKTEDGREIGTVDGLITTGAHDILVVRGRYGKEYLIPALKEFWVSVDHGKGILTVAPAPGLLEINE